jgi:uncharacterized protein (UPF0261 family)
MPSVPSHYMIPTMFSTRLLYCGRRQTTAVNECVNRISNVHTETITKKLNSLIIPKQFLIPISKLTELSSPRITLAVPENNNYVN